MRINLMKMTREEIKMANDKYRAKRKKDYLLGSLGLIVILVLFVFLVASVASVSTVLQAIVLIVCGMVLGWLAAIAVSVISGRY